MNLSKKITMSLLASSLLLLSNGVYADWKLNNEASSLNFVSIKKNTIGEVHRFKQLAGTINAKGEFNTSISLASVDTKVAIRDERMNSMLFDTAAFPKAEISGNTVNPFKAPNAGEAKTESVKLQLAINGKKIELETKLRVVGLGKQGLLVTTIEPLLLDAAALGYGEGLDKLRDIAQLPSISTVVPVTLNLVFDQQ
ncbi:YceI family protein [Methylobacillus gramineus]|uniref:YceI family protein n=1 Tax=Methylobacillus gramineus TaxID=755169 RepID=UPI001CFF90B4|nr:YceI family protein [Methylobacillus gramineus]MCB5184338.1 YceI family protein [Methylobacillus gramineus]